MDNQDQGSLGLSPADYYKLLSQPFVGGKGQGTQSTADPFQELIRRVMEQMRQQGGYSPSPGLQMPGGFTPSPGIGMPGGFTPSPGIQGPPGFAGPDPGSLGLPSGGQSSYIDPQQGPGSTLDLILKSNPKDWGNLDPQLYGGENLRGRGFDPGSHPFGSNTGGSDPFRILGPLEAGSQPNPVQGTIQGRPGSPPGDNRYNYSAPDFSNPDQFGKQSGPLGDLFGSMPPDVNVNRDPIGAPGSTAKYPGPGWDVMNGPMGNWPQPNQAQNNYQPPPQQQQLSPAVLQYLQKVMASQGPVQQPGRPF